MAALRPPAAGCPVLWPVLWLALWTLLGALACVPCLHALYWLGDEGILLHGVQRMGRGQILYRDMFAFYPPAGFLMVRSGLAVFGESLLSARLLTALVIAGIAALTGLACCRTPKEWGFEQALEAGFPLVVRHGAYELRRRDLP